MTDNLPAETAEPGKQDKLIECLAVAKSISEAGRMAGYSDLHCRSGIYTLVKSAKFQNKLRKHYLTKSGALLPKIVQAESDLLNIIALDPEKLSKHNNTVKQIKQAVGVLQPDEGPKQQNVNIQASQLVMQQIITGPKQIEGDIIDA